MLGKSYSKPVVMMDLENNTLKEFSSITEAGKHINKFPSSIGEVCRGGVKTAYGYKWKFKI